MVSWGTYPRTLAFEVLNFTHETAEITNFHRIPLKELLHSYILGIKLAKHLRDFSNYCFKWTLLKFSSITRRQNRYLPSDARSLCEIAGKVNLCGSKWYLPISDTGGHGNFQSQNELLKIKISTAACWSRVSEHPMESLCWVLRVKKYSMRLSDSNFCPRIGALMILTL